jgi:hypothetical protein
MTECETLLPPAGSDGVPLHELADQIEQLLGDLQAIAGPIAWPRVERLVTALVDLYGSGLERMLEHARGAARSPAELDAVLAQDEVVSSLLLLHGVHPLCLEERVTRALERVQRERPSFAPLAFAGLEHDVVVVRLADPTSSAQPPPVSVLARAIETEAPEVTGLRIDGIAMGGRA